VIAARQSGAPAQDLDAAAHAVAGQRPHWRQQGPRRRAPDDDIEVVAGVAVGVAAPR
jgi:hypothetical protein